MVIAHKMHVISRKILMMKNPFILTHTFFFPWVYKDHDIIVLDFYQNCLHDLCGLIVKWPLDDDIFSNCMMVAVVLNVRIVSDENHFQSLSFLSYIYSK